MYEKAELALPLVDDFDPLSSPQVLERVESQICEGKDSCEDCPDVNTDPPSDSDCPYFEMRSGKPICTQEGSYEKQLRRWIGGSIGTGAEDILSLNLVELIETDQTLPDKMY